MRVPHVPVVCDDGGCVGDDGLVTLTAGEAREEGVPVVPVPSTSPLLFASLSGVPVPWTGVVVYGHRCTGFFDLYSLATMTRKWERGDG